MCSALLRLFESRILPNNTHFIDFVSIASGRPFVGLDAHLTVSSWRILGWAAVVC